MIDINAHSSFFDSIMNQWFKNKNQNWFMLKSINSDCRCQDVFTWTLEWSEIIKWALCFLFLRRVNDALDEMHIIFKSFSRQHDDFLNYVKSTIQHDVSKDYERLKF